MKPMPKVAICVPSGDMVHKAFAMSLAAMMVMSGQGNKEQPHIPRALIGCEGSLVTRVRNDCVQLAQQMGVDYLLFLDSDMTYHPETLRRLLAHDKDIVGCTYQTRSEPSRTLGKFLDAKPITSEQLTEVEALPGGCLLIRMSVFEKMTKPYFRTPAHEAAGDDPEWIQGEDYYFCEVARQLGYQIWLDFELSMHIEHYGVKANKLPVAVLDAQIDQGATVAAPSNGELRIVH